MVVWKRNHRIGSAKNDQSEVNISLVFLATRKSGWLAILALCVTYREMGICHANDYEFLKEGDKLGLHPLHLNLPLITKDHKIQKLQSIQTI